jgi:hypothetical protein
LHLCGIVYQRLGNVFDEFFHFDVSLSGDGLGLECCETDEKWKGSKAGWVGD